METTTNTAKTPLIVLMAKAVAEGREGEDYIIKTLPVGKSSVAVVISIPDGKGDKTFTLRLEKTGYIQIMGGDRTTNSTVFYSFRYDKKNHCIPNNIGDAEHDTLELAINVIFSRAWHSKTNVAS